MRNGIIFSALLHIAVILIAVFGLPYLPEPDHDQQPDVIPVDLVHIGDETVNEKPKEEPKPEVKEQTPPPSEPAAAEAQEQTPPSEDAVPLPDVEKKPEQKPKPDTKPAPPAPMATPMVKPTPPSRFDAKRLALLIDKKLQTDQPQSQSKTQTPAKTVTSQQPVMSSIERSQLMASLQAAIRAQVEPCWSVPVGAKDAEDLKVRIRIYLLPDGNLARPPEIVDQMRMNMPGQSYFRVAAESARRAIQRCAPLKLPVESYDIWKDTELTFDPKEMLGG